MSPTGGRPVSAVARSVSAARSGRDHPAMGPMQTAEKAARAIVRCAKRPRPEVILYPPARIFVLINALSPRLADRILLGFRRRLFKKQREVARPGVSVYTRAL